MTDNEVRAVTFTIMEKALCEIISDGALKYADEDNLTAVFDASFSLWGGKPIAKDITEKLVRFFNTGNRRDLYKAMAWLTLLIAKVESEQVVDEGGVVCSLEESESLTTSG